MAAMAPALTDTPAEAHHIRFKLAPPSSTISPDSVENNSNASNILISSSASAKRRAAAGEECPRDFRSGGSSRRKEEQQQQQPPPPPPEPAAPTLGKLQPLVASYLCSDVTPVPSTKESLKLQGVLKQSILKTHGALPSPYSTWKPPALELSGEQLKNIMSGSGPTAPPVNGLTKRPVRPCPEREGAPQVNGGRQPERCSATSRGVLPKGEAEQQCPPPPEVSPPVSPDYPAPAVERPREKPSEREPCSPTDRQGVPLHSPAPAPALASLGAELKDRTLLSQSRQSEIESRLHRLRKRLQVVQAKQVERHVQQQLGGFLQSACGKLRSLDTLRQHGQAVLTRKAEAALRREAGPEAVLARFLKSGAVPAELERFALSGGANLRAAEDAFDSDVTESSSGGETDVEEEELGRADVEQRHISLWRRAEGRYASDRASIICHWNWLQAQISDLEYRIRQQTDIYRQIRSNKGMIVLGDSTTSEASTEEGNGTKAEPVACQLAQDRGSDLWKGCALGRPVNGVINSLHPSLPNHNLLDSSDTEETQAPFTDSSSPDSSCVAARARPVLACRKRRLVRPGTVAHLSRKVQRSARSHCSCDVNPQCVTCGGRIAPCTEFQFERPLLERLSQFDPCVHPILTFNDDVPMNLHLQCVLKSHWQNKPLDKVKPVKKLSVKHKLDPPTTSSSSFCSTKDRHKMTNSLSAAPRLSHHKVRPEKLHRQHLDGVARAPRLEGRAFCRAERGQAFLHGAYDKGHNRKRPREHSLERGEGPYQATPKLYMDSGCLFSTLAGPPTPTHHSLMRQQSTSSEGSVPFALNSQSAASTPPVRRRRGESSFDINNIVIPMSVAATTRVEKLQYKEILTPSWREVDICAQPIAEEDDNVEVEDLSDAAFSQLHLPCEEQERSRWTWTATAKRRGSRSYKSLDGRTTPLLGGTNPSTPQPSSPDTAHSHSLQEYGSLASPCSPPSPHTPSSRDSHRLPSCEDTRCSTPDFTFEDLPVQPWEHRDFPLESDPPSEPEDQGVRRSSGGKAGSSRSESDYGQRPRSDLPTDESTSSFVFLALKK